MSKAFSFAVMLAFALTAAGQPHAKACGYHGGIGDSFSGQHPKSLTVAFAIRDAVDAGKLPAAVLAPLRTGNEFYWRAAQRLGRLQDALSSKRATSEPAPVISVLLIDSRLWARMRPQETGYTLELHAEGPEPGDMVVLTSDAVLGALVDGAVDAAAAFDLKIIDVDGAQPASDWVRSRLINAFAARGTNSVVSLRPVPFVPAR